MIVMIYECEVQCSLTESQMWVLDQRWNRLFSTLLLPTRNSLYSTYILQNVYWYDLDDFQWKEIYIRSKQLLLVLLKPPGRNMRVWFLSSSSVLWSTVWSFSQNMKSTWKSWISWLLKVCRYIFSKFMKLFFRKHS